MKLIEPIKNRYSTVIFSSRPVEEEYLHLILEAARWSPSAFNEQPWRFLIGVKGTGDNYTKLLSSLVESNKYWAQNAPVLILIIAKKIYTHNSLLNKTALYDTGIAVGSMLAQITALKLFAHQMGGFNVDMVKRDFNVPEQFEPIAIMAVGYKDNPDNFADDLKLREKRTRVRKPLSDLSLLT